MPRKGPGEIWGTQDWDTSGQDRGAGREPPLAAILTESGGLLAVSLDVGSTFRLMSKAALCSSHQLRGGHKGRAPPGMWGLVWRAPLTSVMETLGHGSAGPVREPMTRVHVTSGVAHVACAIRTCAYCCAGEAWPWATLLM